MESIFSKNAENLRWVQEEPSEVIKELKIGPVRKFKKFEITFQIKV